MPVNPFKWKHYEGEIILLNVRWYLKYALSGSVAKKLLKGFMEISRNFEVYVMPVITKFPIDSTVLQLL